MGKYATITTQVSAATAVILFGVTDVSSANANYYSSDIESSLRLYIFIMNFYKLTMFLRDYN